ncbi:MAG: restriction endonuclease subunit S [Syntrophomonadaceae bacterium]|nr:restriction endonuclease subunit S [Syntrophomonadaceae bacterium]
MANVKKGHKKTELCEIPEEWEVIKLDKIFDFYGGQPIPRRQLNDDGVAYLHYGDIHTLNRSYRSSPIFCVNSSGHGSDSLS